MPSPHPLLPRSTPAASGMSSRAITALLDRLDAHSVECHSLMIVHRGHVIAEGWWAPYDADRPHLLYSLTKSFTAIAVGLAVTDGLLSPDDRIAQILPEHVPADLHRQAHRLTVHHLLSMTTGHRTDSLAEAWQREPGDLVTGFLRVPFPDPAGTRHAYDNPTTFILARMVEKVTGHTLPDLLDERLFLPMGIDHAEWDRVASGAAFGFHGLHLRTEAVAAFGQLLLREGRWGERQLIPRSWVRLATRPHIDTQPFEDGSGNADYLRGYGYQFWISRHGYHGDGSFGQLCVVVPSHDLVVAVTGAHTRAQAVLDAIWECLLPGVGHAASALDDAASTRDDAGDAASARDDELLAERLRRLSLPPVPGSAAPHRSAKARLDASTEDSALPDATTVAVDPVGGGWLVRFGPFPEIGSLPGAETFLDVEVGHGEWRESSPLGRPVVATGAWQGDTFVAELYVITTPHRVRLVVDTGTGTAVATWNIAPLTGSDLRVHLRSPLMTRPDVA
ncbi:serine hydrolase domain-containing protein [Planobispora rosea]|uniref:serine hydrolase domain-containing protein n=1 Tax=Planobispora rosea TaxID=35762 RepID=UPI00159F22EB|nr:serine hydrolase domain-containing protein [Planobispora rosea]